MSFYLAAWLVTGARPRLAWAAALVTFLCFAGVTAARVVAGETSCGCFGLLEIDPRWVLGLDLAVIAALLWAGPPTGQTAHAAFDTGGSADDVDADGVGQGTDARQRLSPSSALRSLGTWFSVTTFDGSAAVC